MENYQGENLRQEAICKKNDFNDMLLNSEHVRRDVDTLRLRRSSVTWRRTRWRRYMNHHHHHQPPSSLRTSPGKRAPSIRTIQAKTLLFLLSLFFLFQKRISVRDGHSAPWGLDPAEKQVAPPPYLIFVTSATSGARVNFFWPV